MRIQRSFQANEDGGGAAGKGKLYLVATPIGNLEDMTFRAVRTLREVDWIAAEDTRQTRKLLTHYDIRGRLVSYHEHNKAVRGPQIIGKLLSGQSVAQVSDAGLPGISDPGEDLVRLALEQGISVIPIPGANAALSALIVSGLTSTPFAFAGFLPREKKKAAQALEALKAGGGTVVLYEAPHRIEQTLRAIGEAAGDAPAAMARELTKKHEEIVRGSVRDCLEHLQAFPPKGEYCLVVDLGSAPQQPQDQWWRELAVEAHVAHYERQGLERREAMKKAAADRKVSKRDIYNQLLR